MSITQEDRAAAEARIRERLRADGWPDPQTEEELCYAALAHRVVTQSPPAPGLTEEAAMRIAIEETKLSRAERDSSRSA